MGPIWPTGCTVHWAVRSMKQGVYLFWSSVVVKSMVGDQTVWVQILFHHFLAG